MRKFNPPFIANNYYHVFNRAIGSEEMFREPDNYHYFLSKIQQHLLPVCDIFCYSLLPNHFHLFARLKPFADIELVFKNKKPKILQSKYDENLSVFISEQFGNCCNAYAKAYNKRYDRKGKLFMDSLNRKIIESDTYYSKTVHYIHANAAQHGLCKTVEEWPYSFYSSFTNSNPAWILKEEVLDWFGGLQRFIEFHHQPIEQKI